MEARQTMMLELLSGENRRFIIPVFQRNYDWKEEQCTQLFKDIEYVHTNSIRKSHFLGTIVFVSNSEVEMLELREFVLIDGQQRVTSIILLLKAIYDSLMDSSDEESQILRSRILNSYLINQYTPEKFRLRLKPMKEDDVVFQKIMNNDYDFIDKKSNIYKNYNHFIDLIKKSRLSPAEIFKGIQKLIVVYISLNRKEDDPQLIFESLNSTGLNLSEADLIRNFILMGREPDEQESFFEAYWYKIEKLLSNENISDFIRDYLTMKSGSIPKKQEVYLKFKDYVDYNYKKEDIESLLKELLYYARIYSRFIFNVEEDTEISNALENLKQLKTTVCYPFLMDVFNDYQKEDINKDTLVKVLKLIETYIFRRLVCGSPTNALNKVFANLSKEIKESDDFKEDYFEALSILLLNKRNTAAFPLDQEFKQEFLYRNMYKFPHIKYLLASLENYNNNEIVDIESLNIEHVMPQKLDSVWKVKLGNNHELIHEKYLHNIGNLTLTGYNSNLSNKPFENKKVKLRESNLKLNKYFYDIDIWDGEEIERRGKKLFELALKIWPIPVVSKEKLIKKSIIKKDYFDLNDEVDVTGTTPIAFEFLEEKYSTKNWKWFFIDICKILYKLDKEIFTGFTKDNDFAGRKNRIISDVDNMREGYKIDDKVYIETHFNSNTALNNIKLVMEKYGFKDQELIYWIK